MFADRDHCNWQDIVSALVEVGNDNRCLNVENKEIAISYFILQMIMNMLMRIQLSDSLKARKTDLL